MGNETIQRYSLKFNGGRPNLFAVDDGEWVRFADIEPQPSLSAAVQTLEVLVAEWKAKLDAYEGGSNALSCDEAGQLSAWVERFKALYETRLADFKRDEAAWNAALEKLRAEKARLQDMVRFSEELRVEEMRAATAALQRADSAEREKARLEEENRELRGALEYTMKDRANELRCRVANQEAAGRNFDRAEAAEAEKARLEGELAKECPHVAEGKGCSCAVNSRHQWLHAYANERQRREAAESSLAALREENAELRQSLEQLIEDVRALNGADVEFTALRDAVREWKDSTREAEDNASGWTQRVRDAEIALRALVDPQGAKA